MEPSNGFRKTSPCVLSHRKRARRARVTLWSYRGVVENGREDCAALLPRLVEPEEGEEKRDGHRKGRGISNAVGMEQFTQLSVLC